MFIGFKISKKNNEEILYQEEKAIQQKLITKLKKEGYKVEDVFNSTSYALIKEEVQYRSDDYNDFNMKRELTKEEIDNISNDIFNNYDGIYEKLMEVINKKISEIMEGK